MYEYITPQLLNCAKHFNNHINLKREIDHFKVQNWQIILFCIKTTLHSINYDLCLCGTTRNLTQDKNTKTLFTLRYILNINLTNTIKLLRKITDEKLSLIK